MSKLKKVILSILIICSIITIYSITVQYQLVSHLPVILYYLSDINGLSFPVSIYLFWSSIVLIIGLITFLLIVLFYPNKQNELVIKKEKGTLIIKKKSIENFILSSLGRENFIDSPRIKVKMTRSKMKVSIVGDIKKTSDLSDKTIIYAQKIKEELQTLIGVTQEIMIEVTFDNYTKNKPSKPRVQ